MVDIRYEDQVVKAMEEGAKKFGGIDILVKLLVSICWILFYNWVIYNIENEIIKYSFTCN